MSVQPQYNQATYGSAEWLSLRDKIKPAIEHHEAKNSHHLGHYKNGIKDMCLLDVLELIADWSAASLRDSSSNLEENLREAAKRNNWSDDLTQVILNTVKRGYLGNS